MLATPCPLPYDVDFAAVLDAFEADERDEVAAQVDHAFDTVVMTADPAEPDDPQAVVRVQCGVPLFGRTRALLRICTLNFYGDAGRHVNGEYHAWLTLAGDALAAERPPIPGWPSWAVGRSPGLEPRVNLNTATEDELRRVRGIVSARPVPSCKGGLIVSAIPTFSEEVEDDEGAGSNPSDGGSPQARTGQALQG